MTSLLNNKTFLDFFPAPELLLLSNSGIVVTDEDVKFVQLHRAILGGGFKLAHLNRVDGSNGMIEQGSDNYAELVSALKGLSLRYGVRRVQATLPDEKAYLFTTNVDKVPKKDLYDAVAFVIEENVPISLAESIFDFEIVDELSDSSNIKVAVTVLSKSTVDTYIELFEFAGITPISFDIESQAIARAIIPRQDKRSHLIVNLFKRKTGFYIVSDKVVQFSSTSNYGVDGDDLHSNINNLKEEMHKVITFWESRADKSGKLEKKIEKIMVSGIGAGRKEFVEQLMNEVSIEYMLADIWVNVSFPRNQVPEMPFDESLDYASAIGLVLPN